MDINFSRRLLLFPSLASGSRKALPRQFDAGAREVPERLASRIQKVLERGMAERVVEDRLGTPKVFAFSLKRVRVKRVMRGNS
jgi:hypothetical protein